MRTFVLNRGATFDANYGQILAFSVFVRLFIVKTLIYHVLKVSGLASFTLKFDVLNAMNRGFTNNQNRQAKGNSRCEPFLQIFAFTVTRARLAFVGIGFLWHCTRATDAANFTARAISHAANHNRGASDNRTSNHADCYDDDARPRRRGCCYRPQRAFD